MLFFIVHGKFIISQTKPHHIVQANDILVIDGSDTLTNPWTGGFNAVQISKMDLNFDSLEDLFVFDRTGNKITTFINNGSTYSYAPEYEQLFPQSLSDWVLLRDYNNDNKKDIFALFQVELEFGKTPLLTMN